MLYRIVDLPYSKARGGIDDEALQRLLHGHEVLEVSERFYVHEGLPHLLVSVTYRLAALSEPRRLPARAAGGQPAQRGDPPAERDRENRAGSANARDPKAQCPPGEGEWLSILREENVQLFEALRAWRTARSRADGVPPYVILTNVQLAHIANERPRTRAALREIPGLGASRAERYGEEILGVIGHGVFPVGEEAAADAARGAGTERGSGPCHAEQSEVASNDSSAPADAGADCEPQGDAVPGAGRNSQQAEAPGPSGRTVP